jgi:hypothetical protein
MCSRPFETRSLPSSLATTHRGFPFYAAFPKSSIHPSVLPIYVARVPAAPFTHCFPGGLTLITRTARCLCQLPWLRCRLPARLKLVCFPAHSPLPTAALPSMSLSPTLHSLTRDVLYVARVPFGSIEIRSLPNSLIATLATLPSTSLIPSAPFNEAGARNGPILAKCCAREHVKRAIFAAL